MTHGNDSQKKVFIRDRALILYFDAAETPFVARFDLDALATASFEIVGRDSGFALILRDFDSEERQVGRFAAKADAHQALHAILQALLDVSKPRRRCCSNGGFWSTVCKTLLGLLLLVILIYFALDYAFLPYTGPEPASIAKVSTPHPVVAPSHEGEPVDLNSILQPPKE